MSRMLWVLLVFVLAAGALLLLLFVGQRRLIYFPFGGAVPHPREVGLPSAREVTLTTEDGLTLGAWFVEPAGDTAGWTLILFNGNAGNRALRAPLAARLADHGIATLMLDYRGYGGNAGTPSERGLLLDARAARRWVVEQERGRRTGGRIGYFGESLGTGVAVALAAERPPDAVVLRSPYTSLADMAAYHYPLLPARQLLRDRYASIDRIGTLSCPILIVAAERDSVIPPAQARRLFEAARPEARRWLLLPGTDHNDDDALAGDLLIREVVDFLEGAREDRR
jgi:fermentation-respiration switch protein FrsA (DUF1100 family)